MEQVADWNTLELLIPRANAALTPYQLTMLACFDD